MHTFTHHHTWSMTVSHIPVKVLIVIALFVTWSPARTFLLSLNRTINFPNLAFLHAQETRQASVNMSSFFDMGLDLCYAFTNNLQQTGLSLYYISTACFRTDTPEQYG